MLPPFPEALLLLPADGLVADGLLPDFSVPAAFTASGNANTAATAAAMRVFVVSMVVFLSVR
jgi:hypothetical protein